MTNGMDAKDLDLRSAAGPQLTRILRELIIGNRLKAGVRLSEADISQRFGVSRQPVRESFIKLSEEGLLEVRPQRGTFVRRISLRSVEDARFIREAVETDLVQMLAVRPDPALLEELNRQLDAQSALASPNATLAERTEFRHLDDLFHATLAQKAGRTHL